MDIIRIYDDRDIFLNESFIQEDIINDPPIEILIELTKKYDVQLEYCTISEKTQQYEMYRLTKARPKKPQRIKSWAIEKGNRYFAFLDTLWDNTALPKEPKHFEYGNRTYPKALEDNLKCQQVKTLTIYTTFDPKGAEYLEALMREYQADCFAQKEYFPEILTMKHIFCEDRKDILQYLIEPLDLFSMH